MSVDYVVQSGLTTPEDISFSFEPPSSQQLWTPPQQEHAARIYTPYLQRELAIEEALANADFSVRDDSTPFGVDSTPCPIAPGNPSRPIELDFSLASQEQASAELPREVKDQPPPYASAEEDFPSEFDISPPLHAQPPPPVVLKAHQRANLEHRFHARVYSPTSSEDTYQRLVSGLSSTSNHQTTVESYSIDPATLARPSAPEPVSFSYHEGQQTESDHLRNETAGLKKQLQAYKNMADSLIEQTVERSFSDRDERRLFLVTKERDGLASSLQEANNLIKKDDKIITKQKAEIRLLQKERNDLASSLLDANNLIKKENRAFIQQRMEIRLLKKEQDRLVSSLNKEKNRINTQQNKELRLVTKERDSLVSSLQDAYDLIKTLREDITHQADRIEDLEGDLYRTHRELFSLTQRH